MSLGPDSPYRRILDFTEKEGTAMLRMLHLRTTQSVPVAALEPEILEAYAAAKLRKMAYNEAMKAEREVRPVPQIVDHANVCAAARDRTSVSFRRGEDFVFPVIPRPHRSSSPKVAAVCRPTPLRVSARSRLLPVPPTGLQTPSALWPPTAYTAGGLPGFFSPGGLHEPTRLLRVPPNLQPPPGLCHPPAYTAGGLPQFFPPPGLPEPPQRRQEQHVPASSFDFGIPTAMGQYAQFRNTERTALCEGHGISIRLLREVRRPLPTPPDAVTANDLAPLAPRNVNVGGPSIHSSMQRLSIGDVTQGQQVGPGVSGDSKGVWGLGHSLGPTALPYNSPIGGRDDSREQLQVGGHLTHTSDAASVAWDERMYVSTNGYFPGELKLAREGKLLITNHLTTQHNTADTFSGPVQTNIDGPWAPSSWTGAPNRLHWGERLEWSSEAIPVPLFPGDSLQRSRKTHIGWVAESFVQPGSGYFQHSATSRAVQAWV